MGDQPPHSRLRTAVWVAAAALIFPAAQGLARQQAVAPASFRTGVALVPVDVRVVDAAGEPVTDLTAADFTIVEKGRPQQLSLFATRSYLDAAVPAQAPRTFVIALGRGRLNEPGRGIDAAIEFVRRHLAPDDRVGVLAYLQLAEPTSDREAAARLLERYRARHEAIEANLTRDGRRRPGAPDWPLAPDTLALLRALFDAPGLPAVSGFPGAAGGKEANFDDTRSLTRALQYLRHIDGEKHLVFVMERGPAVTDSLVRAAASARVAVSLIQSGDSSAGAGWAGGPPMGAPAGLFGQPGSTAVVDASASRDLAERTGGVAAFHQEPGRAFARVARATAFQYVLGYYPVTPPRDGEYRDVRVSVKRRGLTLLYRRGYETRTTLDDVRGVRDVIVRSRIRAAAEDPDPRPSAEASARRTIIPTKLSAETAGGQPGVVQLAATALIDASDVTFLASGAEYTTTLDVAFFVRDAQKRIVGEHWARLDLRLDEAALARARREGVAQRATIAVAGTPAEVTVFIYDYDADRLGSKALKLR